MQNIFQYRSSLGGNHGLLIKGTMASHCIVPGSRLLGVNLQALWKQPILLTSRQPLDTITVNYITFIWLTPPSCCRRHHWEITDQNYKAIEECSMIYSLHNPVSQLLRSNEPPTPSHDSPCWTPVYHILFTACEHMLSRVLLGNQCASYQIVDLCTL